MITIVTKDNIEDVPKDMKEVITTFETNPYAKYIFYVEEKTLGYLYYSVIYDRIEINYIESKRKGVGSILMEELLKEKLPITLEVSKENERALTLYKKYGFKEVALRKGYYDGVDGILMEKK
ncbi:MAG: GNAT family N-acetyltransferase [Bacilli bacterium]|nr:GNAT family N-acetyltransferase [Bacilli bacterium]